MNRITTTAFGRITVATALAVGLSVGSVGIASAASHPAKATAASAAHKAVSFQGVVSASSTLPGTLVVTNAKGTTKTFTIDTTTKVLPSATAKNAVALAVGERVEIHALAATPTVANRIVILAAKAKRVVAFHGVVSVSSVLPGTLVVTNAKGTTKTFTVDTTTMIVRSSNLKVPAVVAVGDRVEVLALSSSPAVASRVNILGAAK